MHNDKVYSRVSFPPPSCLDSAYERQAMDQGVHFETMFPENKEYYLALQHPVKEWSYNSDTKEYELYLGPSKHGNV